MKKQRTGTYEAIEKVALYYATHRGTSINKCSKNTNICWETVRDCVETLKIIGFFRFLEMQEVFWKIKEFQRDIFDDFEIPKKGD